jgi:tetratricopeptide (TPR) repeat protein
MKLAANWKLSLVALLVATIFVATAQRLKSAPRQSVRVEMQVALPLFVQVFMTVGDRFLAANIAAIRALVVDIPRMKPEEFAILAKVQEDVSWLNPGHEDNYYIAAAILPWQGEFDAAQRILARATKARRFDYQPAFYYGFNLLHFKGDAAGASAWIREAAEYLPEGGDRIQMQNLAAIWMDKAQDVDLAIRVVEAMARQTKRRDFQRYLEMRVTRLRALQSLRGAEAIYRQRFDRAPATLQDLLDTGIVASLPQDPFGFGFEIDRLGRVILRNSPPPKKK